MFCADDNDDDAITFNCRKNGDLDFSNMQKNGGFSLKFWRAF